MRVLAIDTTTARGSVAVVEDRHVLGEVRLLSADRQSGHVMPAVDFLFAHLGFGVETVDGFAVTLGPGSFTGLRVGISSVQGLGLAAGKPCIGLPTLDVLAQRLRGTAPWLVPLMDAYRGQVFAALYDSDARRCSEMVAQDPAAFLAGLPAEAAFLGEGAEKYRELIRAQRPLALFPERSPYLAATLGRLALAGLARGEGRAAQELRPLYLREAEIRPAGGRVGGP
jgi:tRNA threonylcarbamoyladenosine biosynthesis protein TsaB